MLAHKPGALRNGAPCKDWQLPEPPAQIREHLGRRSDGDRQFVGILSAISLYGLEAVAGACAEALAMDTASRDVVLTILSRTGDEPLPDARQMPAHLPELVAPPVADCIRYNELLGESAYAAG